MAEWDTAYINDLPDTAFLVITPGGRKDAQGNTVPRDARYFPVRNAAGQLDPAHVRRALAQIPTATTLTAAQRMAATDKAKALAADHPTSSGRAAPADALETRSFDFLLELRDDGDGRTLMGRAVPYGEAARIPGGSERFVLGAFARQIAANKPGTVKIYASHGDRLTGEQPVGKTTSLSEMVDGLHGAWSLYNTGKANDSLELVRTGEVTGLSIGFRTLPGGSRRAPDGATERVAAHLDHVVLTHEPAYAGAGVMAIRGPGASLAGYRRAQLQQRQILDRLAVPL